MTSASAVRRDVCEKTEGGKGEDTGQHGERRWLSVTEAGGGGRFVNWQDGRGACCRRGRGMAGAAGAARPILHPSSFVLHPSSFAVCCSYFILHSQSLILREFQPSLSHLLVVCVGIYGSGSSNGRKSGAGRALAGLPRGWWRLVRRRVLAPFSAALREWGLCVPIARLVDLAERLLLGSRLKALGPGRVGRPGLISLRRSPQLNCSPSQFSAREAFSLRLSVATVGKMRQTAMERWQEMQVVNKMGSLSL